MQAQAFLSKRLLPGVAAVLLGSVALLCGCTGGSGVIYAPIERDDSADPPLVGDGDPVDEDLLDLLADILTEPPPDHEPPLDGPPPAAGATTPAPPTAPVDDGTPGPHLGEREQLEVDIAFSQEFGETVTDEDGIHYHFDGLVMSEDKVYPSEYWGTYPLYFFGTEVGATVTITNNGPRSVAKLRVETEAYVLLTDGSNGAELAPPQSFDIEVGLGETVTVDASFTAEFDASAANMESGLDRFLVKVYHMHAGGKTDHAGLIMVAEGVFCPPELAGDR
jgi:hypothetical protein